ncbi:uncharacterized protein AMSG_00057 [Thecamonas trahens ATCC 50062]|uniref:Uncharacterized protein n=1 Tax=Thecamonas trahens ATCC 50062 TaxID=461836 RepID=A0A0L0D3R4_THETB|nr:hypothetical protein AMSG_00057 [Thecamonas trahens ATCC 50062]KNC45943.1 hypothetical protein AMSG_00057 [Thecamonas trahens ATCC 50062]|eukprot:XP_013762926.1 hypothetical protein AMSG_00057 [Thecamonas trahens ATCC 50062]
MLSWLSGVADDIAATFDSPSRPRRRPATSSSQSGHSSTASSNSYETDTPAAFLASLPNAARALASAAPQSTTATAVGNSRKQAALLELRASARLDMALAEIRFLSAQAEAASARAGAAEARAEAAAIEAASAQAEANAARADARGLRKRMAASRSAAPPLPPPLPRPAAESTGAGPGTRAALRNVVRIMQRILSKAGLPVPVDLASLEPAGSIEAALYALRTALLSLETHVVAGGKPAPADARAAISTADSLLAIFGLGSEAEAEANSSGSSASSSGSSASSLMLGDSLDELDELDWDAPPRSSGLPTPLLDLVASEPATPPATRSARAAAVRAPAHYRSPLSAINSLTDEPLPLSFARSAASGLSSRNATKVTEVDARATLSALDLSVIPRERSTSPPPSARRTLDVGRRAADKENAM